MDEKSRNPGTWHRAILIEVPGDVGSAGPSEPSEGLEVAPPQHLSGDLRGIPSPPQQTPSLPILAVRLITRVKSLCTLAGKSLVLIREGTDYKRKE